MKEGSRGDEEVGNRHRGIDSGHSHPTQSLPCFGVEGLEIIGSEVLYLGAIRPSGENLGSFQSLYPRILRSLASHPGPRPWRSRLPAQCHKPQAGESQCEQMLLASLGTEQNSKCQSEIFFAEVKVRVKGPRFRSQG